MRTVKHMPRKAPKEVVEHRITFGDYERKEFKETLDSMAYKNYLAPLQSPVVSVALLGGGAYLALAYALDWWPFKREPWKWEDFRPEFLNDYIEAKQNCQLAAYWTADYENRKVPEFNNRISQAQAWLAANPTNKSLFDNVLRKQFQLLVDNEAQLRAKMEEGWLERLANYQEQDRICNIKKGTTPVTDPIDDPTIYPSANPDDYL